jgi:predicted Zn-dependent peptidase
VCLPEFFERVVALHAEFLRTPSFPQEAVQVAVDLARQELHLLEDDAQSLVEKFLARQAFGALLGRHPLGEVETVSLIKRDDVLEFWKRHFQAGRMQVAVAGPIDPQRVADVLARAFEGFGTSLRDGRTSFPLEFSARRTHIFKELEQEQIGICFPGVGVRSPQYPTERVMIGVLSGGMSGRLFTEVREKQGLVYWVGAWHENPRGTGMVFLGASTTPQRADRTFQTLLREVDRLSEDLMQAELDRAVTGIVARTETRGDITRARCGEMADDLFHYGRPVPPAEKLSWVQAVSIEHVKRYLSEHPRSELSVVTLGPRALEEISTEGPRN